MEENKLEELKPLFDDQTKSYSLENYDVIFESANQFCDKCLKTTEITQDKSDYKYLTETRTKVRKTQEAIKKLRIQTNDILLGNFNLQLTSLEKLLGKCDETLKQRVDAYNEKNGEIKAQSYSITISCNDFKVIEKIKAFAEKQVGVNIKVK